VEGEVVKSRRSVWQFRGGVLRGVDRADFVIGWRKIGGGFDNIAQAWGGVLRPICPHTWKRGSWGWDVGGVLVMKSFLDRSMAVDSRVAGTERSGFLRALVRWGGLAVLGALGMASFRKGGVKGVGDGCPVGLGSCVGCSVGSRCAGWRAGGGVAGEQ